MRLTLSTLFSPDSIFLQRFLRSGGYYKGDIDGLIGPKTLTALGEFEANTEHVANEIGSFDKRTEASIGIMLIPTQRAARWPKAFVLLLFYFRPSAVGLSIPTVIAAKKLILPTKNVIGF